MTNNPSARKILKNKTEVEATPVPRLSTPLQRSATDSSNNIRKALDMGILPEDTLAPEAFQDSRYTPGPGSVLAASNLELASEYGVIRKGEFISPHTIRANQAATKSSHPVAPPPEQNIRSTSKTVEELTEALKVSKEYQQQQELSKSEEEDVEEDDGVDEDQLRLFDYLEFELRQRKKLEKRLKPIDLTEYLLQGYAEQEVQISKNFTVAFRSITQRTAKVLNYLTTQDLDKYFENRDSKGKNKDTLDKQLMTEDAVKEKLMTLQLAASLQRINDREFEPIHDSDGEVDMSALVRKYHAVIDYDSQLIAQLHTHFRWFGARVHKLLDVETIETF